MKGLEDYKEFYDEIMQTNAQSKINVESEKNSKHIINENPDYLIPIYELGFKTRTNTELRENKIYTFGDIIEHIGLKIQQRPTNKEYKEAIDKVHDMGYLTKCEYDCISDINNLLQSNLDNKKLNKIKIEEIIMDSNIWIKSKIVKNKIRTLKDIINMTREELFVKSGIYYDRIIEGMHNRGILLIDELNNIKKVSEVGKLSQDELEMVNRVLEYNEGIRGKIQPSRDKKVELDGLIKKDLQKRELLQEAKELEQKYEEQLSMGKIKEFETNEKQGVDFDGE